MPLPTITASAEQPRETRDDLPQQAWRLTAVTAAVFSLMVAAAMILARIDTRSIDLLKPEQLQVLKDNLRSAPNEEKLKTRIREQDLELRRGYFRQLALTSTGGYLLLGGVAVFLLAANKLAALHKRLPLPQPQPESGERSTRTVRLARLSVAVLGAFALLALGSIGWTKGTALPTRPADLAKLLGTPSSEDQAVLRDLPSAEEIRQNWPQFRGPEGNGVSTQTNAPLTWDVNTGQGVVWKVALPLPGFNSPVVWSNRVFLSGGDAAKRAVFCFEARTGEQLWERSVQNVPGSPAQAPEIPEQTGFAASTMATDGRRVYVIFANGDLAAFTLEGNPVWSKHLGVPKNPYGHASSLAISQDRLVVQLDQGESEQPKSRLYAFDGPTGQVVWQRQRPVPSSWATPILASAAGKQQIITLGVPYVIAYAVSDGAEIWRVEGLNGEVTPSPLFAGGLVLAVSPSEKLFAIRPDGQGDVTKTHVLWTAEDNIPDITSPAGTGELIFTLSSGGMLTCYDTKEGKKQWDHDFEMDCHASPSVAGDRLYVIGTKGAVIVMEAGRQFKQLARTEMGESFSASPAFAGNRIFLRGLKHLYCVGAKEEKLAKNLEATRP